MKTRFEIKTVKSGFSKSLFISSAVSFLCKIAAITKKISGNNSNAFARILSIIGFLDNVSQRFSHAIPFHHLSLDIYEDLGKTNKKFYMDCLINLGIAYNKIQDYNNAAKYLNKALKSELLRSGSFSRKYVRCLNYTIDVYYALLDKTNESSLAQSSIYPDSSVIYNELTELCIQKCGILKMKYKSRNPKYLKEYLDSIMELEIVGSSGIAEPYFREVYEFLQNIDDAKAKKFYYAKSLIEERFKFEKEHQHHKKYDEDRLMQLNKNLAALNNVYGNMVEAMNSKDDAVPGFGKSFADHPLTRYDEPLETAEEPENEKPVSTNDLANNLNNSDLAGQIKCSLFSVQEASPGDDIFIQVFTHHPEKTEEAFQLAKEFDGDATIRQSKTFDTEVRKDATLTFELEIKDITVEDPIQHLKWKGITDAVQFIVTIPDSYAKQSLIGKVRVALENVPMGHFCFKIGITVSAVRKKDIGQSGYSPMKNYRYAFISYASKDRSEVLRRVQMLDLLKIRYFQDILNLNPGDRWGKELLRQIDLADVFFLFWSSAARDSEWVLKEVEYAIRKKKGIEDNPPEIYPVILEGPPFVEPPEHLKHLHFNDKIVYFI
jgi:hypothetical protein